MRLHIMSFNSNLRLRVPETEVQAQTCAICPFKRLLQNLWSLKQCLVTSTADVLPSPWTQSKPLTFLKAWGRQPHSGCQEKKPLCTTRGLSGHGTHGIPHQAAYTCPAF